MSRSFRAMNTDVQIVLSRAGSASAMRLDQAVAAFADHEAILSRFDQVSALSALNRAAGEWIVVPELLFRALAAARSLSLETEGLFNPAILEALETAGYDRSFERLGDGANVHTASVPLPPPVDAAYQLDQATGAVQLLPGIRLDLGGIGKGLAVDAAAALLDGERDFLIDAGGDIRVSGESPDGGPWGVAVQDPREPGHDIAVLSLTDCAVATSSVTGRRWASGGEAQHHLIDPRTGRSATSDVLAATVVGHDCARAEVLAKAAVIAGVTGGLALLDSLGMALLLVDRGGRVHVNEQMRPHLARAASE